jgi:hypothetical protein
MSPGRPVRLKILNQMFNDSTSLIRWYGIHAMQFKQRKQLTSRLSLLFDIYYEFNYFNHPNFAEEKKAMQYIYIYILQNPDHRKVKWEWLWFENAKKCLNVLKRVYARPVVFSSSRLVCSESTGVESCATVTISPPNAKIFSLHSLLCQKSEPVNNGLPHGTPCDVKDTLEVSLVTSLVV